MGPPLSALIALGAWLVAEACSPPVPADRVDELSGRAEAAWSTFDLPSLQAYSVALEQDIGCVRQVLKPDQVAAYWRVQVLVNFARGDLGATEFAIRQAQQAYPAYALPMDLVPLTHPLRRMWDMALGLGPLPREPLDEPLSGYFYVDGRRSLDAPSTAPFLFQWASTDAEVSLTQHVRAGATANYPRPVVRRPHPSRTLGLVGASAAAVAAGSFVGAGVLRHKYVVAPASAGPLTGTATANRALGWVAWGSVAVSGGLVGTALVVDGW